jgi:hypothetical protein
MLSLFAYNETRADEEQKVNIFLTLKWVNNFLEITKGFVNSHVNVLWKNILKRAFRFLNSSRFFIK